MKWVKESTCANSGAATEHLVVADLIVKGYEVFRCCGPNSHADLVARNGMDVFFIEVRAASVRANGVIRFLVKESDVCDVYAGVVDGVVVYKSSKDEVELAKQATWGGNRGGPYKPLRASESSNP